MNAKFGLGRVLAMGFRIWARNFVPFVALTAVVHSPLIVWAVVLVQGRLDYQQMQRMSTVEVVSNLTVPLLNVLVSALLTYGVVMQLQGKRASIYACVANGLARLLPALGTMILTCLCVIGAFLCGALPGALGGLLISAIAGSLFALYVYSVFFVSTQAAVLERTDVGDALARSRALTRGHRFAIAVLQVLVLAIALGLEIAISFATYRHSFYPTWYRVGIYLDLARSVLVGSLHATLAGVAYYFLRAEREGTSPDELAAIFD